MEIGRTALLGALLLGGCLSGPQRDGADREVVRLFHEGIEVVGTSREGYAAPKVSCARGPVFAGANFAVRGGFPAFFEAELMEPGEFPVIEVLVFGGTITDPIEGAEVQTTVRGGETVEIARLDRRSLEDGAPVRLRLGVVPTTGTVEQGQGTARIAARAVAPDGIALTTPEVVIGELRTFCP